MSGTLAGDFVHVHCGGYDVYNEQYTRDCFIMVKQAESRLEDKMQMKISESLPYNLA